MPREIPSPVAGAATLEETVDAIAAGFDPRVEESVQAAAEHLARLANNRTFLGDLLLDQLRDAHRTELGAGGYGPQAIVLSPVVGGCFLRANIWPGERDKCLRASGATSLVYGIAHDHNFDFLTAGYFGPGYRSDYYEIEYGDIAGYRGETVALRFVERSALHRGRMLHYRAHRDVHSQHPPSSTSVSLNIVHVDPGQEWYDQYGFDLDGLRISGILNPSASETFLRCAVALGEGGALDLAADFGRNHPSTRMRLACFEARAARESCAAARDRLWREAETAGDLMLSREAHARRTANSAVEQHEQRKAQDHESRADDHERA